MLFVAGWRRSRALALGIGIWILFLLPGANLLFPAGTMLAERLAYLPSLGACLIVGHLFARPVFGAGRNGGRRRGLVAIVVVLGLLAARTVARNPDWHDNLTLARADVETVPRSAKLHGGVGIFLHADGDAKAAAETACIRCGQCVDVCPLHLVPTRLALASRSPPAS